VVASTSSQPISILGVQISGLSEPSIVDWLSKTLASHGRVCQIATCNPEYVIAARRNPSFAAALKRCELVTADGVGITIAARLQGRAIERVTGVRMLELLADTGAPLFLLGAGPGIAEETASKLVARFPRATIAGIWSEGTPDPSDDLRTVERIRASGARIVAVAYGAPAQVLWIERNRVALSEAGVRIAIGVGGAFDYLSGSTPTPPAPIRKLGLEWLWRLVREPRRWRRQLALPQFALLASFEALRMRWAERRVRGG
jgi:N-acetylglucosaminyldiphosphoundecaprenol N-acetyl-beta-D-mannosaminyltransferase